MLHFRTVATGNYCHSEAALTQGGEQQRIVIARALLNNPEVILADEPTGNLDPETGEQIFYLLSEIARQGTSVIIATHNHAMIDRYPGRVFICEQQRLSELP